MHNNTKIESISIPLTTTITAKKVMLLLVMEVTVMINMVTKIKMIITITEKTITTTIIKMTTQPLK